MSNADTYKAIRELKDIDDSVLSIYMNWQNAKAHQQRRLDRIAENMRYYAALYNELGLGQWPERAVAYMAATNRQLLTYNFIKPIVDTVAGGIMQVPFDPEFYPVNSEITSLTKAIKTAMYSDKEVMDWNLAYRDLVEHGLICEGVIKPVISNQWHPLGNIGFEICLPGSVISDPMWRTARSRDCEWCMHEQWFMPDKILEMWGDRVPQLEAEVWALKRTGMQYGDTQGVTPGFTEANTWGSAHRVISEYRMINERKTRDYLITDTGKIDIPDLPDAAAKIHWLNMTFGEGGWEPDRVGEERYTDRVCYVRRICPSLSWRTSLEEEKHEWQTGALPFFWWSASRVNGEPHGLVDSVKDPQLNINYWQSLITHKIQTEGGGGSQFIDRSKFADDKEADRYIANRNNPLECFDVMAGALDGQQLPAIPTVKSQFPHEVYQHLDHIINVLMPHISKVTPTTRGMTEQTQESGYLYKLMKTQSDLQLYTIYFGLRQFWNEVYESYLIQASYTYANEQVARTFTANKGKESITLNEKVELPDGSIGIKNDASQLRSIRHKVIISEAQQTPTKKLEDLQVIGEFVSKLPPTKIASINYLVNKSAKLIDSLDEEDQEALEALGEEELELSIAQVRMQRAQAELAAVSAEMQLANIKKQMAAAQAQPAAQPQAAPQIPQEQIQPAPQAPEQPINAPGPQAQGVA